MRGSGGGKGCEGKGGGMGGEEVEEVVVRR